MARKKKHEIPILKVPKGATLQQIYQCAREQFTAADLQKFTQIEPMVPAEKVLAKLDEIHRKGTAKWEKNRKRRRSEPDA
jgi:hypothetical protein